jgi:hypothetical protein
MGLAMKVLAFCLLEKVETVKSLPKNQVLPLLLLILLAAVARAVAAQVRPAPHLMVALTISQAQP